MNGGASVGPPGEVAHGHSPLPDLALAGDALRELHALWAHRGEQPVTVYVGLDSRSGRVHVGWIRDMERKAVRLSGPTLELAMESARIWTRGNGPRAGR